MAPPGSALLALPSVRLPSFTTTVKVQLSFGRTPNVTVLRFNARCFLAAEMLHEGGVVSLAGATPGLELGARPVAGVL
jgi:hypothetical protein